MQCFFSIYSEKLDILLIINYCKYSIKPPKGLFLSIRFRGGGRGGGGNREERQVLFSGEMGCRTAFLNKEKMALLFFIKNIQFTKRKGHAAEEQKQI